MAFFFILMFMAVVFWRPQEWLVPWLYGGYPLYFVMGAAVLALMVELQQGRIVAPRSPVPILFVALFLAALMSHVSHGYFEGLLWTLDDTWKISFFAIAMFLTLNSPRRMRWVAVTIVAMSCVMAVHALLQYHRGAGFAGQAPIRGFRPGLELPITRTVFFGIFEDPNDLGQMLAAAVPFTFALTWRKGFLHIVAGAALSALLIAGLDTTKSRGGQMGLIASGIMTVVLFLPVRWIPYVLGLGTLVALGLCPYSGPYLDQAAHDRAIFWGEGNYVFRNNPIFGVGYGMFSEAIGYPNAAHNAFVLAYTEMGFVGYFVWFTLMALGLMGCWRTRRALGALDTEEAGYLRRFSGVALAGMVGFMVSAYFLSRAYVYPLFFLVTTLNAVPTIAQRMLPGDHRSLLPSGVPLFLWGLAGSAISIVYIYLSIVFLNMAWGG